MTTQYAFYFDSTACTGCKACQVACKDKHDLPIGTLWRRVYEIAGGDWAKEGNTWSNTTFAYYLSISCNHCENPVCALECPSEAITKRDDGIVIIDPEACSGYRRCVDACPYGSPQFNRELEKATKCDLCYDYIDQGLPPACVAACPSRSLDFGEYAELQAKYEGVRDVFPLPDSSETGPAIHIIPHKDAAKATKQTAEIANKNEV